MQTNSNAALRRRIATSWIKRMGCFLGLSLLAATAELPGALAAEIPDVAVEQPLISCGSLAKADLSGAAGAQVIITPVKLVNSPIDAFCRVVGNVAPTNGFEINLPIRTLQLRDLQSGCGGLCGTDNPGVSNAGAPALTGGFVVSSDDTGHSGGNGMGDASFGRDPLFDLLSPLMAWVEGREAPSRIIAAKVPQMPMGPPLGGSTAAANGPAPLPQGDGTPLGTRPVFAYPMVEIYSDPGDVEQAASYLPVWSKMTVVPVREWEGAALYAPDFLKSYAVLDATHTVAGRK